MSDESTPLIDIGREINGDEIIATFAFFNDESFVRLRWVKQSELEQLAKKSKRVRTWNAQHQPAEELDRDDANRRLGRAAVVGWDLAGFLIGGKAPPEYTPEACDWLINKWGRFSRFVNETCVDFDRMIDAEREETKKNSVPT